MMLWSLFLLILTGQCSFLTCQLYEYHFIEERKTWDEAQKYCREHYTDLAKVYNMTDMTRLLELMHADEAWIGLYNATQEARRFHWSLPGVEFDNETTQWIPGEPNDGGKRRPKIENCVMLKPSVQNKWNDANCINININFVCFRETEQPNEKFHLIKENKTWPEAQSLCRENYTDLVSGLSQLNDSEFKKELHPAKRNVWIGLFRDTWRWSDKSDFSFRNWNLSFTNEGNSKTCATVVKETKKWNADDCKQKKTFFCYEDKVILIRENMTWTEALEYCRFHHSDLVSITDHHQQKWVEKRVENADTDYVWLGLSYTCTLDFWFWISDECITYENWASQERGDDCDKSAAMGKKEQYKWVTKSDDEKFNFICSEY